MQKVYLILGASSDLGSTLMRRLLAGTEENEVFLAHYHSSKDNIQSIIDDYPKAAIECFQADLGNLEDTKRLIEKIKERDRLPTHIVNFSASAYRFNRLSEFNVERLSKDINIQVYSFALICQAFIPDMVEKKSGKIVSMLSAATKGIPPKNTTEYTTVKYALLGLLKSLAADYGDAGISINGISPGMIETKFLKNIGRKIKEFNAEKSPQHRNLQVDDVVPAILFLLSEDSDFMNGTNLNLTGNVE